MYKPTSNDKMQLLKLSNNAMPRSLNDREERSSCAVKFSPPPKVDLGRLGGVRAAPRRPGLPAPGGATVPSEGHGGGSPVGQGEADTVSQRCARGGRGVGEQVGEIQNTGNSPDTINGTTDEPSQPCGQTDIQARRTPANKHCRHSIKLCNTTICETIPHPMSPAWRHQPLRP